MPPTQSEIEAAAKKSPASRDTTEQKMVDDAKSAGNQTASNLDAAARETQRVWGR